MESKSLLNELLDLFKNLYVSFHSKKVMYIQQEIYAHLIMYNFTQMITSHVAISTKQRKYTYKANFSVAVHMCKLFYIGKRTSPHVENVSDQGKSSVRNAVDTETTDCTF